MIDEVFQLNRFRSSTFLSHILFLVKDKQDQLQDLKHTQQDLALIEQQLDDEKQEMRKKIEEMSVLSGLRRERDEALVEIQD